MILIMLKKRQVDYPLTRIEKAQAVLKIAKYTDALF